MYSEHKKNNKSGNDDKNNNSSNCNTPLITMTYCPEQKQIYNNNNKRWVT